MKNILKYFCIFAALSLTASCNDWLNVGSEEEVFEDDAFASVKGYRSALIGIYKTVASPSL